MSNVAQVLVQLLEKVPNADELQRLLEPETLLYLLQHYGYQKEELQKRLRSGTLPGELLLELLEKEPNVGELFFLLSNNMDTRVEKRVNLDEIISQGKKKEEAPPTPSTPVPDTTPKLAPVAPTALTQIAMSSSTNAISDENSNFFGNNYFIIALVIIAATSITPALMQSGFFPDLSPAPAITTMIALIGGALAGAVFSYGSTSSSWQGVLIGIVFNVGVLWATIVYTQARTSLFKIEIVIPLFLGALPAAALYYALNRKN